ncbi:MAG: hypothetical protein CVU07_00880 [Bacteroidetes bacterium HGW-Bacteroidetes-23]|nr:MAG: hypothetical protein CVU07_00880 [Bacteroidetes bacterium HGW-Bacteroidetes-23]
MKQFKGNIFFEEDNFENGIAATLSIDGDKYEIEFIENNYRHSNYKIIQGEFNDLGYVTFIDCIHSGRTSSTVNVNRYISYHLITEIKFNKSENIVASSLHVTMSLLKELIKKSNLKGDLIYEKKLEYITPEKVKLYENEDFLILINFYISESRNIYDGIKIKEYCVLEIKSKKDSKNIFELFNVYKKIKIFFSFIGFFSKYEDEFKFREDNIIYTNQDGPIDMRFFTTNFNTHNNGLIAHERFDFNDIKNEINQILNNWFTNDSIQDSIILVMEKYTFIKLTVETYFLNTCFAIETFHRKNKFNEVYKKTEFNRIKRGIRNKLETEEEIELFNDKLIYANEPTFKNRLISLKSEFKRVIHESVDIDDYVDKIVSTRNFLVHRGNKKYIFEGLELYYAAVYLETLTKFCIMETIGIDNEVLSKVFNNTSNRIKQFYEFNVNNKFM